MDPDASVTQWIEALREQGDESAAEHLWQRYFAQLVSRIRPQIASQFHKVSDEEDVALSALDTLFRGIRAERFPELKDRESLWNLLLTLAERRTIRHFRKERAQKRGAGCVVGQSERDPRDGDESEGSTSPFVDGNPSPEFVATVLDELSVRLEQLDDPVLRQIALLDLEGYSPREIQERLGLGSERTVFRKKKLLRSIWQQMIEDLGELT